MPFDTAKFFLLVSIGDNIRVTITKVFRGKLGKNIILGVVIEYCGIYFTIRTKNDSINHI